MKFRKKPVIVEATQWWPGDDVEGVVSGASDIVPQWLRDEARKLGLRTVDFGFVTSMEGGHIAAPGDFIITGVHGERYPCQPDIFAETYEPVIER